jgi:GH25 family lysozyme M1 (1,4-beta-N-acetylmuramidase)
MEYNFFDKFKRFSIQHRGLMVSLFSVLLLTMFMMTFGVSFSSKFFSREQEFEEIQSLMNEIKEKDALVYNMYKVNEVNKTVKGIDVSSWQGKINWEKVKESGVDFVILRVGLRNIEDGEINEDYQFRYNASECNRLGIPIGVYFFSTARSEIEVLEEASFTLNIIKDYKITYPVAYDLESFGEGRLKRVSDDTINYNALVFLDYFKVHGYNGMLYSNLNDIRYHWDLSRFSNYKIWYANYSGEMYTGRVDMYQYSDEGRRNGVYASVDDNIAYFAYEEVIEQVVE